jgi:DNA-binding MarR family transcriptional regulator
LPPVIPLDFLLGLSAGLVLAGALYLFIRWRSRRSAPTGPPPAGAMSSTTDTSEWSAPRPLAIAPDRPTDLAPTGTAPGVSEPIPASTPAIVRPSSPDPNVRPVRSDLPATDRFRLSQRVILHVYAQGILAPGEVAPDGLCQAGMGEALGIPQSGLAAVLRRLEAAGIFTTERGHVRGRDRRLKIYRLTSRGLQVAKELRTRAPRRTVEPSRTEPRPVSRVSPAVPSSAVPAILPD